MTAKKSPRAGPRVSWVEPIYLPFMSDHDVIYIAKERVMNSSDQLFEYTKILYTFLNNRIYMYLLKIIENSLKHGGQY